MFDVEAGSSILPSMIQDETSQTWPAFVTRIGGGYWLSDQCKFG